MKGNHLKIFGFVLIGLFLTTFSYAKNNYSDSSWIAVGTSSKGAKKWFISNRYVAKNYEGIKIWIRILDPLVTKDHKTYKNAEIKTLIIVDCEQKTFREIKSVFYTSEGTVFKTANTQNSTFRDVVIDSIMEIVVDNVCKLYNDED